MFISVILSFLVILDNINGNSEVPLISGYLSSQDKEILRKFFLAELNKDSNDHTELFNSLLGLDALGEKLSEPEKICSRFPVPIKDSVSAFFRVTVAKLLGSNKCQWSNSELEKIASNVLVNGASAESVYQIVSALRYANLTVDSGKVTKILENIRSTDSGLVSGAYIIKTVTKLNLPKESLKEYFPQVIKLLESADELDGTQLYFDRGLFSTALVAESISGLIAVFGEIGEIPEHKLVKLINFIYTRRHSTNLRAAAHLLTALKSYSMNPVLTPIVFEPSYPSGKDRLNSIFVVDDDGMVRLKVFTLWGEPLPHSDTIKILAGGLFMINTATRTQTPFDSQTDRGLFVNAKDNNAVKQLSVADSKGSLPPHGFYALSISASSASSKSNFIGAQNVQLPVQITFTVHVVESTLSIKDRHHDNAVPTDIRLVPDQTHSSPIHVEQDHYLFMLVRLAVHSKDGAADATAHQVFVQLTHKSTQQSITFVCESAVLDSKSSYTFKLDPKSSAADFDYLSGVYKMELFVGDALIRNPLIWYMADLDIVFDGQPGADSAARSIASNDESRHRVPSSAGQKRLNSMIGSGPRKALPELHHTFKQPEKRAPRILSLLFTVLCALPLLALFISWMCIGVNVWNFSFYPSNIIFHAGLIAIFGLNYMYWTRLDMFTTIRYLVFLAIPTFLAGNSVLRSQVAARQASSSYSSSASSKK